MCIRDSRSTTPQRSSQGSKTAEGRKRSPCERADLDGENVVVAWVDTASPPPHATVPIVMYAGIAGPVSYTPLTLPTSDLGQISVVAVSIKKKKRKKKKKTPQ